MRIPRCDFPLLSFATTCYATRCCASGTSVLTPASNRKSQWISPDDARYVLHSHMYTRSLVTKIFPQQAGMHMTPGKKNLQIPCIFSANTKQRSVILPHGTQKKQTMAKYDVILRSIGKRKGVEGREGGG